MSDEKKDVTSFAASDSQEQKILDLINEVLQSLHLSSDEATLLLSTSDDFKLLFHARLHELIKALTFTPQYVDVPDLNYKDTLMLLAKSTLIHINPIFENWDFYRDGNKNMIVGQGLKYETLMCKPHPDLFVEHNIYSDVIEDYFHARGFKGHTGAFLEWCRNTELHGLFTTVLPKNEMFNSKDPYNQSVPYLFRNTKKSELFVCDTSVQPWSPKWTFVGFRIVR